MIYIPTGGVHDAILKYSCSTRAFFMSLYY